MLAAAFQALGDQLTKALICGDFDLYRAVMDLPLIIAPRDAQPYVLSDDAALEADFNLYHQIVAAHGVTDIYREVRSYDRLTPMQVQVHCISHIMVRATRIIEPFETRMMMLFKAGDWRIAEIESSEGHINWSLGRARISPSGRFEAIG